MRLDHLLSKEEKVGVVLLLCYQGITKAEELAAFREESFPGERESRSEVPNERRPAEQNMLCIF